jgi:hypothetical protein
LPPFFQLLCEGNGDAYNTKSVSKLCVGVFPVSTATSRYASLPRALQVTEEIQSACVLYQYRIANALTSPGERKYIKWPPLGALGALVDMPCGSDVQEGTVIGIPQFLLDFAILGFEKKRIFTLKQMHRLWAQKEENINLN